MKRLLATLAVALVCAFAVSATALAGNLKFEFEGVAFADGTTGTIYASSKLTGNGNTFTQCGYYDEASQPLGEFGSAGFFSDDAAAVEQYCLDHFAARS